MNIKSISVRTFDSSYGGYPYVADVVAEFQAKDWTRAKAKGGLGALYLDVSNEVYRLTNRLVPAWNPSVSHDARAKSGIKTVRLSYYFRDHEAAIALGLEVRKLASGECLARYGTCATVYTGGAK